MGVSAKFRSRQSPSPVRFRETASHISFNFGRIETIRNKHIDCENRRIHCAHSGTDGGGEETDIDFGAIDNPTHKDNVISK